MKLNTGPSRINSRKSAGAEQATTRVSYSSPSRSTSSKHRPSSSAYYPSSHRGGNPRISSTSSNHPTRDSCSPSRPTSSHRRSAPNPPASYAPARQETSGNVANGNWPAKFSPKKEQTQASGNMGPATVQQTPTAPYYPPKSPFGKHKVSLL